ncbi:unnamed protein product [Heterobilharzia americana]|nr:unnamed protein product [Heterobilharzia americana]
MNRGLADTSIKNHLQAKDLILCNEISTSLGEFKKFLIEQKKHHEELAALSYDHLITLRDELKTLNQQVSSSISSLRHTSTAISRLKADVLKEEKNAELAHKTSEHGLSIKNDSNEITSYFMKKINDFDTRMKLYKQELEVFEENVYSQPLTPMTPRDLLNVLHRMDHDFINLAAQLYTVHESMKTVKANYLKKYRLCYGSARNPFGDKDDFCHNSQIEVDSLFGSKGRKGSSFSSPYGPSPFLTSDVPVTSSSITSAEKTSIIPSLSSAIPSSTTPLSQQFGTVVSTQSAPFFSQTGVLGSSGLTTAGTTSSLLKPVFGFAPTVSAAATTATGFSLFGQSTGLNTLSGGLGNIATSVGDSPFGKRFAS